jgi:hypothetical protein
MTEKGDTSNITKPAGQISVFFSQFITENVQMDLVYDGDAIEAVGRPDLGLFTVRFALNVVGEYYVNGQRSQIGALWIDARL